MLFEKVNNSLELGCKCAGVPVFGCFEFGW